MSQPPSSWVDIDGPVHFVDFGGPADGPVVVCVHGLGGSLLNWLAVGPELARSCRVLALDLPAHGLTPVEGRSTSVHEIQRLLHRFITEVAGSPAVLMGNSMGGMLTILQAAADPDSVAGAVLVDPALAHHVTARPDPLVAAAFLGYAVPGIGERLLRQRRGRFTPEQLVQQALWLCCAEPERVPQEIIEASVVLAKRRMEHPELDAGFLSAARSLLRVLARPAAYHAAMKGIRVPVLMIHGDRDRLVHVHSARAVAQRHPQWRYEELPDVGHVPPLETPDEVVAVVLDWLSTEGAPAAERARRAVVPLPGGGR